MKETLRLALEQACAAIGITNARIALEYPENPEHGEFSTNVALAYAKEAKSSPCALAEKIVAELKKTGPTATPDFVASIEIAGPGFINFKIKDEALSKAAIMQRQAPKKTGRKVLIEHTDPNTFKPFHIGHLMATTIGECMSRLMQNTGAEVVRMCYPSDVGLHIAKSIWAWKKNAALTPAETVSMKEKTIFLGKMYVEGTAAYEAEPAKTEIETINKLLYSKADAEVNSYYEKGKKWSIGYYDYLYAKLGTKFDTFIFESEIASVGRDIVQEYVKKGVFEVSDGATVFNGEKFGLHTRVFVNSQGLPTYEAKEIGLNITKFKRYTDLDLSIIVTANEINEYFKVLLKALSLIDENVSSKTKHIGHGLLRFTSGKMSSRTGKVILGEDLIDDIKEMVMEKMKDREMDSEIADQIANDVAVAAFKYTVLRQAIGGDVIFDPGKSISFEGDSGPYLQYSAVRANSVLEKAKSFKAGKMIMPQKAGLLEKLLTRFDDVAARAAAEYSPQHVATYLIDLAGAFNSFYNANMILDEKEPEAAYRIELTRSFRDTVTAGLNLLGIKVPVKM
jgi:arginyl-tRNA synthetase